MIKCVVIDGVVIFEGTRQYDLFKSSDPKAHKTARRLFDYCRKASDAFYNYEKIQKLREQYSDVL